jgi:apyrase
MSLRATRFPAAVGAFLILFSLACASAPGPAIDAATDFDSWRYALVIDASSSASTLQIYEWLPSAGDALPRVKAAPRVQTDGTGETWGTRVKPGLGSYRGRPDEAARSLEPLIDYALEKIGADTSTLARASLFLRATAGMRLLGSGEQKEILASVERYLETTPFGSTSARVITGAEEGVYGWITANYVLGHLEHGGLFPTVGALDLGGASTQITFQPLDFPVRHAQAVTLGQNTHHLYTKSYLGLGQDDAREKVASPACFLVGYPTDKGPGTGDFDACRDSIRQTLMATCPEDEQPCSLFGSYQPPLYGDFLALSVYAYAADFFDLGQQLRPEEMEIAGRAFCAKDWRLWLVDEPSVADNPYVPNYCYAAAHIVTLLTDGFGFPADSDRISAPLRVQGAPIGWTLGALVYELAGRAD